ncbi:MAG: hypothetical protein GX421_12545 [Caldisericales bacterium]|nr:hypothetical protein [Caldisericales bacterium]
MGIKFRDGRFISLDSPIDLEVTLRSTDSDVISEAKSAGIAKLYLYPTVQIVMETDQLELANG